jgi:hypothetical protein
MAQTPFEIFGKAILVDRNATLAAYAIARGESCECAYCDNFRHVRERLFSSELRDFLAQFGIDWRKPSEVIQYCRVAPGRHLYEAVFHLFGEIPYDGEPPQSQTPGAHNPSGAIAGVDVAFHAGYFPGEEVWMKPGVILLHLEFSDVPWGLNAPEPD